MRKTRYTLNVKTLCATIAAYSLLLVGCAEANLIYDEEPGTVVPETEGTVNIRPISDGYLLPAQLYHFYPENGGELPHPAPCDGRGNFTGNMLTGTYRVIAVNATVENVEYSNMDSYEEATVHATNLIDVNARQQQPGNTRAAVSPTGVSRAGDIGNIYSTVCQEVKVVAGETVTQAPQPVQLTRFVTLHIEPAPALAPLIIGMDGTLNGIYPSVNLATGLTAPTEVKRSPEMAMAFEAQPENTVWVVHIQVFGLCDPKDGEAYESKLSLNLHLRNYNEPEAVDISLTAVISELMDKYDGNIPVSIPLDIKIGLDWNGIIVTGKVNAWSIGDEEEVVVEREQ